MQIYCLKMYNFFRFGESNGCLILDILPEYANIPLDDLYVQIRKDPLTHIEKVKKQGVTSLTSIAGCIGEDFDNSNGTGKSTILEAICYAFFEQIVRKNSTDSTFAVTKINGKYPEDLKESYVEVIFEENEKVYILKRGRAFAKGHKSHSKILKFDEIGTNSSDSQSGHRTTDTDESVAKVINTTFDIFVNGPMFGQGSDASVFLAGTDSTRKEMLISLLHLDNILNQLLEKAREKKNTKQKEVDILDAQTSLMADNLQNKPKTEALKSQIVDKEKLIRDSAIVSESYKKQLDELSQNDTVKQLEVVRVEGNRTKAELAEKKKQKENQVAEWTKLEGESLRSILCKNDEIKKADKKLEDLKYKLDEDKKKIETFSMEDKKKDLDKVEKAKAAKPKYDKMEKELTDKYVAINKSIATLDSDIKRYQKEVDLLQKQLDSAGDKSEFLCDKCKSIVSKAHIEKELGLNADRKKTAETTVAIDVKNLAKCEEDRSKASEMRKKVDEWIGKEGKIHSDISHYEDNKKNVELLEKLIADTLVDIENKKVEEKALGEKAKEYKLKIEEIGRIYEGEINSITARLNELSEKFKILNKSAEEINNKIEGIKRQIEEVSKRKATYNSEIGSLQKEIDTIIVDTKKLEAMRTKGAEERKILSRLIGLDSILGLEGVQTRIINKYLPMLNIYVAEFMNVLSNGMISVELKINERSKIDIAIGGGSANTFEMLSGGEKTLIKMAVSVGLALLSFTRCKQRPQFIALDEVCGPLDVSHVDAVFKLLSRLQNKFERVLIISHSQEINDRIPHRILVEKDEGMMGRSKIKKVV